MTDTEPEMAAADPFGLQRFVAAQAPVFASALDELKKGRKRTHWMWFVFPQLRGLGSSSMATVYGVGSLEEARAYLAHPLLGPRLVLCTEAVLAIKGKALREIFGSPDDMKFGSSMTLFAQASDDDSWVFGRTLDVYCQGRLDDRTLALLRNGANS
jgi:uncharacterized protein (DUF1810 family)